MFIYGGYFSGTVQQFASACLRSAQSCALLGFHRQTIPKRLKWSETVDVLTNVLCNG